VYPPDHQGNFISANPKIEKVLAIDFRKQVTRKHIVGATGRRMYTTVNPTLKDSIRIKIS